MGSFFIFDIDRSWVYQYEPLIRYIQWFILCKEK